MNAHRLLDRLDRVRQVAPQRWIASCPAHDDKSPSLSVRELDDGRVLVHDFGGCDAGNVLAAVGMSLSDLYPERVKTNGRPTKPNHSHAAREALRVLSVEALIVALSAENIAEDVVLTDEDRDRLRIAAARIRAAAEVVV